MKLTLCRATPGVLVVALVAAASSCGPPGGTRTASSPIAVAAYPPRDLATLALKTRAEQSNFTQTSTYADVMTFIDSLKASSKDVHVATFGRAPSGREIPMVIVSRPLVKTAVEAQRLHRPIVYIQGNIHGGEVEGKEALLALLRDLARDPYENVLDSVVIVAVPIYNIDGNDSLGPQERNRPSQQGPALVGRRANGQGLDLNRDYIKAEAPETQASLAFFREWEPDVFIDLHTTNGSYHGYALTWAPPLNPASRFSGPFTRDTILPDIQTLLRTRLRIETFPYGNFVSNDSIERGWFTYDHRPRYGTNYYGLRGRVGILSEAYSHDPFAKRIASTYSFVAQLLGYISHHWDDFVDVGREADRRTTSFGTMPGASPPIAIRSRITTTPRVTTMLVEEVVRTGDSTRTEPGLRPGLRRTGNTRSVKVPVYDRFDPVLEQTIPYAFVIPQEQAPVVLEHMRRHGLFIEQLVEGTTLPVERFAIDSIARRGQPFQGHQEVSLEGRWQRDSVALPAGTYVLRGGQPKAILMLYLLDPQSDDGLVTWNVMDPWLQQGQHYPILRVPDRFDAVLRNVR